MDGIQRCDKCGGVVNGAGEFSDVVQRCNCRRRGRGFNRYRPPAEDAFDLEIEVAEPEDQALLGHLGS